MLPTSLMTGANATFLDSKYRNWLQDPASVEPEWAAFFEDSTNGEVTSGIHAPPGPDRRSIFAPKGAAAEGAVSPAQAGLQARVARLVDAYRDWGHARSTIDPLDRPRELTMPELTLGYHGLTTGDLATTVDTTGVEGMADQATVGQLVEHLQRAYCGAFGVEFTHIVSADQRAWVQDRIEALPAEGALSKAEAERLLRKLSDAENFERLLHVRFPGAKRFSLEGSESLVGALDLMISEAARHHADEIVMGMAHRGRLSTMVNVLGKPAWRIVEEYKDQTPKDIAGDVKYHLGYDSQTTTADGHEVLLSLSPNPSHLEAVNAVVAGRIRSRQDRGIGHAPLKQTMGVLVHGDAAFVGQGVVAENLQMSELEGFGVGGMIHVVVNNQVGFTTSPEDGRSSPYATDFAKMLGVPIFHVNDERPEAVAAVVKLAVQWRQAFGRDVVIDLIGYRKYGHNEGDEPSFTQPRMYDLIKRRKTPRHAVGEQLKARGLLTDADITRIMDASREAMEAQGNRPEGEVVPYDGVQSSPRVGPWSELGGATLSDAVDTSVPAERLQALLTAANTAPDGFTPHRKVTRLLKQRLDVANGERPFDWAMAEQAAFSSLLTEGYAVRLTGQDVRRGTFSHRHAVWTDARTGELYTSMNHLEDDQRRIEVYDSNLSEYAVLGFEYGYTVDAPDALVLWEAQFGDFANGAQIMFDQFISSSEQKWNRNSGLVMLLPHGYEGQGPEHSSCRLERYLQMTAQDNFQVANCTTPANYFHILRRQMVRKVRKPLVLATPKSLLRHSDATSPMSDLASGSFQPLLADPRDVAADGVKRVIFCSGRVYYDLAAALKDTDAASSILIHRVEQLFPLPVDEIKAALDALPEHVEVLWVQEEPKNMGPWSHIAMSWLDLLPEVRLPRYVGRAAAASPATGSHSKHASEQQTLVQEALALG